MPQTANQMRTQRAADRTTVAVRDALNRLGDACPPRWAAIGRLRLNHPGASLAELGELATPQQTKHMIAGCLRRLLCLAAAEAPSTGG